jgi:hypothetical protein
LTDEEGCPGNRAAFWFLLKIFCIFVKKYFMVVVVEKKYSRKKVDQLINDLKPVKLFDPKKFAGKINWEEDPLVYQKRIRNEWD